MTSTRQPVVIGELEAENTAEKIELVLHRGKEGSGLQVRSLRWAQGIGWFVQKTINLDEKQLKNLAHLLRQARRGSPDHRSKRKSKVVDLPLWKSKDSEL